MAFSASPPPFPHTPPHPDQPRLGLGITSSISSSPDSSSSSVGAIGGGAGAAVLLLAAFLHRRRCAQRRRGQPIQRVTGVTIWKPWASPHRKSAPPLGRGTTTQGTSSTDQEQNSPVPRRHVSAAGALRGCASIERGSRLAAFYSMGSPLQAKRIPRSRLAVRRQPVAKAKLVDQADHNPDLSAAVTPAMVIDRMVSEMHISEIHVSEMRTKVAYPSTDLSLLARRLGERPPRPRFETRRKTLCKSPEMNLKSMSSVSENGIDDERGRLHPAPQWKNLSFPRRLGERPAHSRFKMRRRAQCRSDEAMCATREVQPPCQPPIIGASIPQLSLRPRSKSGTFLRRETGKGFGSSNRLSTDYITPRGANGTTTRSPMSFRIEDSVAPPPAAIPPAAIPPAAQEPAPKAVKRLATGLQSLAPLSLASQTLGGQSAKMHKSGSFSSMQFMRPALGETPCCLPGCSPLSSPVGIDPSANRFGGDGAFELDDPGAQGPHPPPLIAGQLSSQGSSCELPLASPNTPNIGGGSLVESRIARVREARVQRDAARAKLRKNMDQEVKGRARAKFHTRTPGQKPLSRPSSERCARTDDAVADSAAADDTMKAHVGAEDMAFESMYASCRNSGRVLPRVRLSQDLPLPRVTSEVDPADADPADAESDPADDADEDPSDDPEDHPGDAARPDPPPYCAL